MRITAKAVRWPLAVLVAFYGAVFAADLLAPYDYFAQDRRFPLAPPTRLHIVDVEGRIHLRPFVYRLTGERNAPGGYVEDRSEAFPVRFFVVDRTDRAVGTDSTRRRLVGVDGEARLFLLGTDRLGRDQLSRFLHGGRISLGASLLAGLGAVGLGLALGVLAGAFGGWLDAVLMRVAELFMALPWIYLLIGVRAFLPLRVSPVQAFVTTVLILGVLGWVRPARLVRGVVLAAREGGSVTAARGLGASRLHLLWHHLAPAAWSVALTQLAIVVPRYVLAEVTLSFLGLGMPEPVPSWGSMLAALQQVHLLVSCWWMAAPAVALVAVVLSYHLLADGLRRELADREGAR